MVRVAEAMLGALSGGCEAAMIGARGAFSDLKCDQVSDALPMIRATPPSTARSARFDLRFGTPAASSWVADKPATDWTGTAAADPTSGPATSGPEANGPDMAGAEVSDTGPDLSGLLSIR